MIIDNPLALDNPRLLRYYLEDASAYMQCDLSSAKFHLGMFTEYTFVLAEGTFDDVTSLFKVC